MSYIEVRQVFKVFGARPASVLARAKQGASKDELLSETGHTLGLRDVSLSIEKGEIFVIMGLSGSGKSTLIRHFNRLIDPTDGQILVDGTDVMTLTRGELETFRRRTMSMVFQRFGLLPHKTVEDNVAFGLELQGVPVEERRRRAAEWIETVGLGGYESSYPAQLSGGMQQRVGLARALCTDADVLLMDEPFSALDPLIRSEMQDQLMRLQAKLHKTIVFITHDLDEALRLGDRIAILKDGELSQVGRPEQIILNPADDYVEAFVRDVNRVRTLTLDVVMLPPPLRLSAERVDEALKKLRAAREDYGYVCTDGEFRGLVSCDALESALGDGAAQPSLAQLADSAQSFPRDTVLQEVLPVVLDSPNPVAVVDDRGDLCGIVSRRAMIDALGDTNGAEPGRESKPR